MPKHRTNMLEPIPLLDRHGADLTRWFTAAGGSPWLQRRVGHQTIADTARKVCSSPLLNTVAFQAHTPVQRLVPADRATQTEVAARPVLDRWLVSAANALASGVRAGLEGFET